MGFIAMNNDQYVRKRIKELRKIKKVTEHQMSLDLGLSHGYIQNIMSCRALPSMSIFFKICDYFEVTPQEFFNEETYNPPLVNQVVDKSRNLSDNELNVVLGVLNAISKDKVETGASS